MPKAQKRTTKSESSRRTDLYDERHRLKFPAGGWAAVSLPILRLLQHEEMDRAVRVLFYLIEHSWAMLIPPAGYKGDDRFRDDWRPSVFAVKEPEKPNGRAKSPFWSLVYIRAKDIADALGLDEGNVSKELWWLAARGVIRADSKGRPIAPYQVLDNPSGLTREKLSKSTTSDFQHPYFQQLFAFKGRLEASYQEAKTAALAPVEEAYRPILNQVNTQEKELKRADTKARKQGVDLSKVVKVDNFPELTSIVPADLIQKIQPVTQPPTETEVVKVDNFKPLSPIRRVVNSDNFSPRIKNIGRDKDLETTTTGLDHGPEGVSVVVAQVLAALSEHGKTTEAAAAKFVAACQSARPGVQPAEIAETINGMAASFGRGTKNPMGVLLTQVPLALKAPKAPDPPRREPTREQTAEQQEHYRRVALDTLNDPRSDDRDRELAREVLARFEAEATA